MSNASQRAARLEERTASVLKTTRVRRRHRGESAPDTFPITLASGAVLQPEAKSRKRLPKLLTDALAQAKRYAVAAIPVAILREHGGRALVALDLDAFAMLVGIKPLQLPKQPALPLGGSR
jgi:hypothetical protein